MGQKINTAIVLAGGFGTRLQSVVSDVPKPMAAVLGRPFLTYLLDYLIAQGIDQVVLSTGHLSNVVSDYFGDTYRSVHLNYSVEETPLGTGGAIQFALRKVVAESVVVVNGDSFLDVDLRGILRNFDNNLDGMMVLREMRNPDRYGTVKLDADNRLIAFEEKQQRLDYGLINGGIYILKRSLFEQYATKRAFSIEEDFFKPHISALNIKGIVAKGYFIDIGLPEDYKRAQQDFGNFQYSEWN